MSRYNFDNRTELVCSSLSNLARPDNVHHSAFICSRPSAVDGVHDLIVNRVLTASQRDSNIQELVWKLDGPAMSGQFIRYAVVRDIIV